MVLTYEEQRLQNIRENEALLKSLGIARPASPVKKAQTPAKKKATPLKRKLDSSGAENGSGEESGSVKRSDSVRSARRAVDAGADGEVSTPSTRRRSMRFEGKEAPDYLKEVVTPRSSPAGTPRRRGRDESEELEDGRQRNAQKLGVRLHNPKTFGHIPGVEVGRQWATRMDASTDAIHAPTVAGIYGNAQDGAWSVALSGGYADDIDLGDRFTYTGCGGRDLKGTKQNPKNLRTAPQTYNQSFDHPPNAALKRSAETGKPVRVIRGFKLTSKFAPASGYRYDGLYIVKDAHMAKGLTNGLLVCKYAFVRMEGQPPLPVRDLEAEAAGEDSGAEEEEADSEV
ncbi:hypothetical protein IAT38_008090 [Cryptococcus sp. DSM 104549]